MHLYAPARRRRGHRRASRRVSQHYMPQVRTLPQSICQQRQAVRGCHQDPHIAVLQDKTDLLRFEQRIHRHEHPTGRRRAKTGDHRLETFLQVDGHAVPPGQTQGHEAGGELAHSRIQFRVCQRGRAAGQRHGLGRPLGRHCNQLGQQHGFGHDEGGGEGRVLDSLKPLRATSCGCQFRHRERATCRPLFR